MDSRLDRLFDDYDRGRVSRRGLLAALVPLIAAEPAKAAETLTVKTVNHVSLNVTDIDKSREFYQSLFGAPVVSKQSNGINIAMGAVSFLFRARTVRARCSRVSRKTQCEASDSRPRWGKRALFPRSRQYHDPASGAELSRLISRARVPARAVAREAGRRLDRLRRRIRAH